MSFSDELEKHPLLQTKRKTPLWDGPESNTPNGGITFSLLSRFFCCRERFRLHVVGGLSPQDTFNHRIEYGSMWHVCEEELERVGGKFGKDNDYLFYEQALLQYATSLCKRYPGQQDQVKHWWNVCKQQFPIYVDYWSKQTKPNRKILLSEQVFNVPYELSSGRIVYLRGKWDQVDLDDEGIWVTDHKTKGDIDQTAIMRQLRFDLQTMLYVVAFAEPVPGSIHAKYHQPIAGVRYNVIRRPLSGGKYTIRQHQPTKSNPRGESSADFYTRLGALICSDPEWFFMRWNTEISSEDITRFRRTCLDPILEQLCDWWDWVGRLREEPFDTKGSGGIHWRHPYGVYNPMDNGGFGDLDYCIETGSRIGLRQLDNLFPELQGET